MQRSLIEILGKIPWGTHFCQFYETPEDLIDILVPYFKAGLQQGEICMWVTSEPLRVEEAGAALRRAMPELDDYLSRGQIEILDYSQWYTAAGKFDADRVLAGWVEKERRARERGYQGLRLTGNTFWLEKGDWNDFADYEATVDSVIQNHRMIAICTYALQRCSAIEVIEVVNNHQFALIKRAGRWEIMENRQRRRAEEQVQQLNRELEERIKRRTAELRTANESLEREIAERTATQRRQAMTNALLELFARKTTRKEYLDAVVEVVRDWSGCRCAGIRVVDEQGRAPYESYLGFSREFWELENWLCVKRDICICIRVILGTPEPQDVPMVTPAGSFCVNNAIQFDKGLPPEQQARFRGNCVRAGFASIAAIPIRYRDETLGVIHLADEREGMVPAACIEFIESMTPLIGEAVHRFNAEAELGKHREHLEELVRQRTDQLQRTAQDLARSNKDLEQFAYVASHDLQEPLRAVAGYAGLLKRRYAGRLDEKADGYIEAAVEGAGRMQSLISDLLAYSRVDTRGRTPEPADARAALDDALSNLQASIREAGAAIHVAPLPTVEADCRQLTQLFQNLVGNAIKFRSDQPPEIRIDAGRDGNAWLFSVQDNGIGIGPEYAERIFLIFQRLHTRAKYPGTGIGLAICKRIVQRHGGRIWVESQPGQGSTFYFTIPDRGAHR